MPKPELTPLRLLLSMAAVALLLAAFALPYRIPVEPTVSQSYACGFNNHAALLLFLAGGLFLAIGTGGLGPPAEAVNKRMPRWTFFGAVLTTLLLCTVWRLDRIGKPLGSESHYQLDRQVAMIGGARLYHDLEFIYGPLLVYPGYWIQSLCHTTPLRAYMASWFFDWVVGTAMLWCMIQWLDLPTRFRLPVFLFLDVFTLVGLPSEGTHYTPIRMFCAGFFSVAVSAFWRRRGKPVPTAALMVGAVLCGFLISPEQGTALGLGLSAYALLLAWKMPGRFPWRVALFVPVCTAAIAGAAQVSGILRSMSGFARGGNNFPLLPSPMNLLVLVVYLVALAVTYRAVRRAEWNAAVLPLALCGLPMMSSAFGRCDLEHLLSAVPLFLVGVFWLASRTWTFVPWIALACWILLPLGGVVERVGGALHKGLAGTAMAGAAAPAVKPAELAIPQRPGYFAPFALPVGTDGRARWGAESGYFFGTQNVLTPEDIAAKAREIRKRRAPFLLLPDKPGPPVMHFWAPEEDIRVVQAAEASPWAPVPRQSLPSTREVTSAIESMYTETDYRQDGWRVWALR